MLESIFQKVAGLEACMSIKKRLKHRCFPVNIVKALRTVFSIEHLSCFLLELRHFLVNDT